jgi:hypothetical protein
VDWVWTGLSSTGMANWSVGYCFSNMEVIGLAWLFYLIGYDLISEAWFKVGSVKWR